MVEEPGDRFAFRHALTREAVVAELLARERRLLHRQIADAIEALEPASREIYLADYAAHCFDAGLWQQALDASRRVGERAASMYATHEAVEHFSRALTAAERLGVSRPADLLRARGVLEETLGEFEKARADHEAALAAARAAGDARGEWQSLLDLGYLWAARDYDQTGDYFHRALDLARGLDDPRALAQSLNRLGNWYVNGDRAPESFTYHEEALAIFERLVDRRGIAQTLDLLGLAAHEGGDFARSAEQYQRAIALFRALDDRRGLASALAIYSLRAGAAPAETTAPSGMDLRQGYALARESLAVAAAIGWRAGEAYARITLGGALLALGEYARALIELRAALETSREIEHRHWLSLSHWLLGAAYLDLFAPSPAHQHLTASLELARVSHAAMSIRFSAAELARVLVVQGDLVGAAALLDDALGATEPTDTIAARHCWLARGELALARGDPATALSVAERLIATAPNPDGRVIPHVERLRGEALVALGRTPEAEPALRAARSEAETQGLRPLLWRIDIALGSLYRVAGRRLDAQHAYDAARETIGRLAVGVPDEPVADAGGVSLRQQFLAGATALLPRPRPETPLRLTKQAYDGLTARERQVAAFVARGCSNSEIASVLVVSERTVETHVGNIYAKLGFSARAQIAVWAAEKGLLQDAR